MEMEIRQHHRLRLRHHLGNSFIYIILGLIALMPLIWQTFGSNVVKKWHLFNDVEYSLYWYLTILFMRVKAVLWPIVVVLAKKRHYNLIYIFIGYEAIMVIDHIFFYSQSSFDVYIKGIGVVEVGARVIISLLLAIYMIYYHYKYEHTR